MSEKDPMLLLVRRPVSTKEWAVSLALLATIAIGGFKLLDPVVQSVFRTEGRVARVEDRVGMMDRRLERVEDALVGRGQGGAQAAAYHPQAGAKP